MNLVAVLNEYSQRGYQVGLVVQSGGFCVLVSDSKGRSGLISQRDLPTTRQVSDQQFRQAIEQAIGRMLKAEL